MNKSVTTIAAFLMGVATGSVATWYLVKNKYEQIAQEEIESVKETFAKRTTNDQAEDEEACEEEQEVTEEEISEYKDQVNKSGYINYSDISKPEEKKKKEEPMVKNIDDVEAPYEISPEEFGENYDYEAITLYYYEDGALTDDNDELLDNAEDVIGGKALDELVDYEEDSMYIRNDRRKIDYEILQVSEKYFDVK